MGTVLSTVAANPCSVLSLFPSVTLWYCVVMRLTLREWLGALTRRDALLGKSVEAEATCLSPVACYCGGMVNGVVLSLIHWSNAPVTPDLVRRGSSSDSLGQGRADNVLVAVR